MSPGRKESKQSELWVTTREITKPASHPFSEKLSVVLDECQFYRKAERPCQRFYKPVKGRPSIAPSVYFRALLIGYCEGIDATTLKANGGDALDCAARQRQELCLGTTKRGREDPQL